MLIFNLHKIAQAPLQKCVVFLNVIEPVSSEVLQCHLVASFMITLEEYSSLKR